MDNCVFEIRRVDDAHGSIFENQSRPTGRCDAYSPVKEISGVGWFAGVKWLRDMQEELPVGQYVCIACYARSTNVHFVQGLWAFTVADRKVAVPGV